MKKIRILLADDHKLMRMGLSSLIAGERDMECVGEASNGIAAVEAAERLRPDVVIMDLMMPKMNGAEATKLIHGKLPDVRIVILTSYGTSREMSDAIANGASGTLMKDVATAELTRVIRAVAAGETVIPPQLQTMSKELQETPQLTEHQKQILSSIAIGRTNADIAKEFGISQSTVKNIIMTIFSKLGASNRAEAADIARRKRLLTSRSA